VSGAGQAGYQTGNGGAAPGAPPAEPAAFVTIWANKFGQRFNAERSMNLAELERVIVAVRPHEAKDKLPLLKLAKFGRTKHINPQTSKWSYRSNENVLEVHGIESDYDGRKLPMRHATDILDRQGIGYLAYTTSSHTNDAPCWRVIVLLAAPLVGTTDYLDKTRAFYCGVLNAILSPTATDGKAAGILAGESFTLSQSYFFGPVKDKHPTQTARREGLCIDTWMNRQDAPPKPVYAAPKPKGENGAGGDADYNTTTDDDLLRVIGCDAELAAHLNLSGYGAMLSFTSRKAMAGASADDITAAMLEAMGPSPPPMSSDGRDRRAVARELAESAVRKYGESRKPNGHASGDGADKHANGFDGDYGRDYDPRAARGEAGPNSAAETPTPAEWPKPVNILADFQAAPFDGTEVPDCLAEYPRLYARQTGFDLTIGLTAAVTCAAAAINDGVRPCASRKTNHYQSARLFEVAIGGAGSGKSPSQKEMLKPLWELHFELHRSWEAQMQAHKRDAKDGASSEPPPPEPCVVVTDTTVEALSDTLAAPCNHRGVLYAPDEFDSWIGGLNQYRNAGAGRDSAEWRKLFDGGPNNVRRVGRKTVLVPNWAASVLTCTTPSVMKALTKSLPADGLMQRLMPFVVRRAIAEEDVDGAAIEKARERYQDTIRHLWGLDPCTVEMTPEAAARFRRFRDENADIVEAMEAHDPALAGHLAKHDAMLLRLALVFHAAVCVQGTPSQWSPASKPVSLDTVELAIRYLKRVTQHAIAVYGGREGGSPSYELAREIARHVLARPPNKAREIARRDLLQSVRPFYKADERTQAACLALLEDMGWLRPAPKGTGYDKGHPTHYLINPAVLESFKARAEKERRQRAKVRELIAESVKERREDRAA
jgi:hypothetical protein